jgi:hypothetical protein
MKTRARVSTVNRKKVRRVFMVERSSVVKGALWHAGLRPSFGYLPNIGMNYR